TFEVRMRSPLACKEEERLPSPFTACRKMFVTSGGRRPQRGRIPKHRASSAPPWVGVSYRGHRNAVRYRAADIGARTFLSHALRGAMNWLRTQGGGLAPLPWAL